MSRLLIAAISFAYGVCYTKNIYTEKEKTINRVTDRTKAEEIARK